MWWKSKAGAVSETVNEERLVSNLEARVDRLRLHVEQRRVR
jgi:hypothetical protein